MNIKISKWLQVWIITLGLLCARSFTTIHGNFACTCARICAYTI